MSARLRLALLVCVCAAGGVRAQTATPQAPVPAARPAAPETATPRTDPTDSAAWEGDGGLVGRARDNVVVSIALAVVVLGGIAAGVLFVVQRRKQQSGGGGRAVPVSLHPDRVAGAVPDAVQQRIVAMDAEIARLRGVVEGLQGEMRALQVPAPAAPVEAPAASAAPAAPPASAASPMEVVARQFVEWCRTRGMLASKLPQFAEHLGAGLPGASVTPVYRDLDVAGRTVTFTSLHGGTAAPAEYWLVELDGERWLLPQPQGPAQFRDLAPVFDGTVAPRDLQAFVPASVTEQGGLYTLSRPGRVG